MAIYLDNAATTPIDPRILEVMLPYLTNKWYNPSSLYSKSVQIQEDVELARQTVLDCIGGTGKGQIYFTSGGSEANCMAIQGFRKQCIADYYFPVIIKSTIEHKSIVDCVEDSQHNHYLAPVDEEGFVNIDVLENIISSILESNADNELIPQKILVSIQMANNEIGTIQNIRAISQMVHKYKDVVLHVDAVQALGHIPIDVKYLGIDMLSASGHKIGCPKGIGFLYVKNRIKIKPIIYGSQMDGMRGGTENVPYIIGMAKAIKLCKNNMIKNEARLTTVRDYLITLLEDKFGCKVNGSKVARLSNNINVTFPHKYMTGESLLYALDTAGIYVGTGSSCNSHSVKPSYVLKAIGLTDEECARTIRITLSADTTIDDANKVGLEIRKALRIMEKCAGESLDEL